ncbi:MAG TPA: YciI family protein [Gemmatimonadaceae bacterium]|nr:YciI family protein [Gemmatimonadaceae bacterium]
MRYVVTYEGTADYREKAMANIAGHRALWHTYHDDGRLLLIGPFTDEPAGGAMAVFSTRAAAEQFVRDDPFVANGVVARWTIREWNEVLAPDQ